MAREHAIELAADLTHDRLDREAAAGHRVEYVGHRHRAQRRAQAVAGEIADQQAQPTFAERRR